MKREKNPAIVRYINKLNRPLKHLSSTDREEIVREIEGHIMERWEIDSKGTFDEESLKGVLGKMGTPEMIAAQYCEQRGWARPPKNHTVRNTILIICAIFAVTILGVTYFGSRYIVRPALDAFGIVKGGGRLIKIGDDGIEILGGKISISDDGIKVGDIISIGEGEEVGEEAGKGEGKLEINIKGSLDFKLAKDATETFTIPAKDINSIILNNKNGSIEINGADVEEIEVDYRKKVYGPDKEKAGQIISNLKLDYRKEGDKVFLEGNYPAKPSGITGFGLDIELTVPKRISATIIGNNGSIEVEGLSGRLDVDSSNGSVEVSGIGGGVAISVKNGRVEAGKIGGDAQVKTSTGSIEVSGVKGNAILKSNIGRMEVTDVGGSLQAETSTGAAEVSGVAGDIRVGTKIGRIEVNLLRDYGFTMSAEANVGSVDCDFPTTKSGKMVSAKVGDGSHTIELSTNTGSIDVNQD